MTKALHSVTEIQKNQILLRVTVQLQHLQCHQALVHYKEVCLNELKRKRASSGIYSQNEVCTGHKRSWKAHTEPTSEAGGLIHFEMKISELQSTIRIKSK